MQKETTIWQKFKLFKHISATLLNLPFGFWATVCKTVRPMLSVRCPVCLSVQSVCLSVTFVHCGQTVGRIKMKHGTQVGLGLGHTVLDGDPVPPPPKGHSPQFSAHISCGQMAAWIKVSLGTELGRGPCDSLPNFLPISVVAKRLDASRCHLVRM